MDDAGAGLRITLATLAVWRVAHLLAAEDGPADALARLRSRIGEGELGELMDCFNCLSIWVAAPASVAVARSRRDRLMTWLALSGAACLLERATSGHADAAAEIPAWKGEVDGLLWQEAKGSEPETADGGEPARGADVSSLSTPGRVDVTRGP